MKSRKNFLHNNLFFMLANHQCGKVFPLATCHRTFCTWLIFFFNKTKITELQKYLSNCKHIQDRASCLKLYQRFVNVMPNVPASMQQLGLVYFRVLQNYLQHISSILKVFSRETMLVCSQITCVFLNICPITTSTL